MLCYSAFAARGAAAAAGAGILRGRGGPCHGQKESARQGRDQSLGPHIFLYVWLLNVSPMMFLLFICI